EVFDGKYYRYADPNYSIKNHPVSQNDVRLMNEAIQLLKEFKDFSFFKDMNGVIHRLEDSVFQTDSVKPIIHLDKNESLRGLEYIDSIYKAIQQRKALQIHYKSFKARQESILDVHPQFLKEFNNRWFVICFHKTSLLTLALDRIEGIQVIDIPYIDKNINADEYFKDIIGVTVSEGNSIENIDFFVDKSNANYVKTKPFHHSQQILEEQEDGTVFRIKVRHNFELERLFLGFGSSIKVLYPLRFRLRMIAILKKALENY
ncbi:MAG: WYL domain-containing protein, partial [Capnocytophaga sp.]|nr:WYL domain-containing protein [Capnocytophaga sp.]